MEHGYTRAMRASTWIVAGLAGAATYWVCLMFMVAREGIGPGDHLSLAGRGIPILIGGLVVAAILRRSSKSS